MMDSTTYLLSVAVAGIAVLLVLVIRVRLEPFVSLLLVSAGVAVAAGIPLAEIVPGMEAGMGKVLAHVAPIVGLGAMLGKMLELSGGAQKIADSLLRMFGERRTPLALGVTGLIFGVPVFFDVGIIVLAPVVYAAARRGGRSMLYYALPLAGGLAIVHGLLPPHPGPVAAAGLLGANLGLIIVFGAICAVPGWFLGGYLYSRWIADRIFVPIPDYVEESFHDEFAEGHRPVGDTPTPGTPTQGTPTQGTPTQGAPADRTPSGGAAAARTGTATIRRHDVEPQARTGLGTTLRIILLPIALILLNTFSGILIDDKNNPARVVFSFVGAPLTALLIAVLVAFYVLGVRRGWSREHLATGRERAQAGRHDLARRRRRRRVRQRAGCQRRGQSARRQPHPYRPSADRPRVGAADRPGLGDGRHCRHLRNRRRARLAGPPLPAGPRAACHRDWGRCHLHLTHQRRRLLAGQPAVRDQREGHAEVLDGAGNDHGLHRVRRRRGAQPRLLTPPPPTLRAAAPGRPAPSAASQGRSS
jgi:H+/gluconate symporter-like permease